MATRRKIKRARRKLVKTYFMLCEKGLEHLGPCEIVIGSLDDAIRSATVTSKINRSHGYKSHILIGDKSGVIVSEVK